MFRVLKRPDDTNPENALQNNEKSNYTFKIKV